MKSLGDGLMVVFDSAAQSLACAVAMQQALDARNGRAAERLGVEDHSFESLGGLELKGISEPVHAFELIWEPAPVGGISLPERLRELPATAYVGLALGETESSAGAAPHLGLHNMHYRAWKGTRKTGHSFTFPGPALSLRRSARRRRGHPSHR